MTRSRITSFRDAFSGLGTMFRHEPNARIHLAITVCVIIAGICFRLSAAEWIAITFAIGFVFTAEILNTSIEKLADFVSPQKHENIKRVKDLAAAGVLISAIASAVIGLIIFIPKISGLFIR
ncbi:MAG: diacylglycerol kinase family protein [Bacteroidales bacterium]